MPLKYLICKPSFEILSNLQIILLVFAFQPVHRYPQITLSIFEALSVYLSEENR